MLSKRAYLPATVSQSIQQQGEEKQIHDQYNCIHIDYYMVFLIPALISAGVDCISLSPQCEG